MKTIVLASCLAFSLLSHGAAHSQAYPTKPVRLILGPAPGGSTDILSRIFTSKLSEIWGQQIVIENRPGAGNTIAAAIAAKATPDGYTLLLCPISEAIAPALYKSLPYDLLEDFKPISRLGTTPNILVVHPSVPAKSVKEFIAHAKANPAKVHYGSAGVGTTLHLGMELLKTITGINIVHVPYKAGAQSIADMVGGHIHAMLANLPAQLPNIRAGKVRPLGVSTATRHAQVPDVPTIMESGVPGFEVTVWYGVCAPSKVPERILARINTDMVKALKTPDLHQRLANNGVDAAPTTRDEFAAFIKAELTKWAKVVKDAGIQPQ